MKATAWMCLRLPGAGDRNHFKFVQGQNH